ncbi:LPS export ABC transporter periplasmic protein LptC [Shewanella avicenniae]|uniref:Lipopolysaccharide export system protein LptC n=1 Tax=Shewanella avicenniae TaxID=2814294 RepID=A0ABX7QRR7_9GAMM|nr:LPS export ABC transporter periplasmic protein LptC [Shewanella avicenniae]QSX34104.1 LPS export ABC transporter periplasmic protein LptC [Shewanella avicenniae]
MNRVTLAIIAFFAAAIVLYWQVQSKRNEQQPTTVSTVERPDYVADNLKSVSFDENGKVSTRVSATHMAHFADTDTTLFEKPIYHIYPDNGDAQWKMSADQGQLNRTQHKVVLQNNVMIDAITPKDPIRSLTTEYLELDVSTMIMTSPEQVFMSGSGFNASGVGLYADLNAQQLKLLSDIKGTYESK